MGHATSGETLISLAGKPHDQRVYERAKLAARRDA